MKKNKAHGPDGVNVDFYLATWLVINDLFCEAVKHLFSTGNMPHGPNSSFISLVPKINSPTKMQDFRPISLCTVFYKCVSKIISSRLKLVLESVIDISQFAFIPGMSISDNIFIA